MLVPLILAGGSGTRLWPLSREALPKQLVKVVGEETLLQQTARRLLEVAPAESVLVVGAKVHDPLVVKQLAAVDQGLGRHRLLEPLGRNTAAAIALGALHVVDRLAPDALLLVCPSDHLIRAPQALLDAVRRARPVAAAGTLMTFGISPSRPETGYGYIRIGDALPDADGVHGVAAFIEKPPLDRAEAMLAAGGHVWNSGIFLFRADRILEEMERYAPAILQAVRAAHDNARETAAGALEVPADLYREVPAEPIDKAVMERTGRLAVVPCDPLWSDLGSWHAVWEQLDKDGDGNAVSGDVLLADTAGCLVRGGRRLVACAGVRDLAVVETDDALLVADRNQPDAVRALVAALKGAKRVEAEAPLAEERPWGRFQVIHEGPGFKVKEIVVEPGGRLSLQSHEHRAEHWVVVRGRARVTVDDRVVDLDPNQSVHIPLHARHRMENPFEAPMHLIEVQCGSYLGEDDIVRYEDVYGRS